jgi:hypothetical protein
MIKHIVFWKLRDDITGVEREQLLRQIKSGFEALQGKIPGLLKIEIGINFAAGADAADFSLYSEFDSRASLDAYATHPEHDRMVQIVKPNRIERRVCDYER